MNRTLQVAKREFVENMRTKTFWIGILAFPVILALLIGGQILLSKAKQIQPYAVLDLSEQLIAAEVESEARAADLSRIRKGVVEIPSATELETALLEAKAELPEGDPRVQLVDIQLKYADVLSAQIAGEEVDSDRLSAFTFEAYVWYQQNSAFLEEMLSGLDLKKYRHVELSELGIEDAPREEQERVLNEKVSSGELFAYFVFEGDLTQDLSGCVYVSNNVTDDDLRNWYERAATRVVRELRIAAANIDRAVAKRIQAAVDFKEDRVGEAGVREKVEDVDKGFGFAPAAFVYLLWIAVFTAAQMLLTNTVEEKSNRIIEVLLSSVSPRQLMSGKIWGIAATGLTIVCSWVAFALMGVFLLPKFIEGFDFPLANIIGDPLYLGSFVAYFLAGYLLYAAILVAIGSVCNSLKEAQNLMQPVFILLIVPLIAMIPIVNEPNGPVARVMTYIPLFTPFTMMNRAGGPPPAWEYVLSSILIVLSILIAFWAAAKVFRIGILMTGKPPRLKEILGWLKAPVGAVPVRRDPLRDNPT